MKIEKKNIRQLSQPDIEKYFEEIGEKKFRVKQVWEWLWQKHAHSFDAMTNLGKELRAHLAEKFTLPALTVDAIQYSADGTIKSRFKTFDGHLVEGVLIPTEERKTACVSSQIGCSLSCKFCATGYMEKKRNLDFDEIYDEVVLINQQSEKVHEKKLSNIVFMGMGEPLLNYKNVMESILKITSPEGLNISPQRITLSTAGVAKMIKKLGDDNVKFNLALSLHAANDEKRNKLMPINETNSLEALAEALAYFYEKTETRITYEYIVFKDFNDTLQDAIELAVFCKKVPCKLNIIEYNPIEDGEFQQTTPERLQAFVGYLESKNVIVNIRRSRGKDIDAACGQLANKKMKG